jgi:hypothetical protein
MTKKNSFAGKKMWNYKNTFTYPNHENIRFQIQLDKMGQIYDIHQASVEITKDLETKKRNIKVTVGDRPQKLFEIIKGRPYDLASPWIDDYIENYSEIDS